MKILLTFLLLYIDTFNKVEAYIVKTVEISRNPTPYITIKKPDKVKGEKDSTIENYKITTEKPSDPDETLMITFFYSANDGKSLYYSSVEFCDADFSDIDGTVAAILAQAWGMKNESVCPIENNFYESKSVFEIPDAYFGDFEPKSDAIELRLVHIDDEKIAKFYIFDDKGWEKWNLGT